MITARAAALVEMFRSGLETTERLTPAEQDLVYRALLDTIRARRPESVGYLSQLPPPGDPIRDPRG